MSKDVIVIHLPPPKKRHRLTESHACKDSLSNVKNEPAMDITALVGHYLLIPDLSGLASLSTPLVPLPHE